MVRMRNWADRDTASVAYGDGDDGLYNSYVGGNDRGRSSYSRRSRSRSQGRSIYKNEGDEYGDGDEGSYDNNEYDDGYDRQNGGNDGHHEGHRGDRHRRDDGGRKYKSTPRESIDEEDHSPQK